MTMKERLKSIGPTAIIAGAIVGPGTVTTSTVIGVNYGFALLWVLLLVIAFQLALHDMTTRLALAGGKTFQEAIREDIENPLLRNIVIIVVAISIALIGLSFMVGNLTGAGLGVQFFIPTSVGTLAVIIGIITWCIIFTGSYKFIENAIKYMVMAFGLSFLFTAIISKPDIGLLLKGLFVPSIPEGSWATVLALVGTCGIGGYPLFLHTNAIKSKWPGVENLGRARNDLFIMLPVALITTAMIIISASAMYGSGVQVTSAAVMGQQFEPLFGSLAKYIFAIGLFSAGISSAIPCSMAVAWVLTGVFGVKSDINGTPYRIIISVLLLLVMIMAFLGKRPVQLIIGAQAVNGVLGPLTAIVLIWLTNKRSLMKEYVNSTLVNILGSVAVILSLILAIRTFISFF